ncbi:MAG: HAD-IA family hydrolase [Chloroflexota bacterium]
MASRLLNVRTAVFDLDGTLTDSADGICSTVERALAERGIRAPDRMVIRGMIGLPLRQMVAEHVPAVRASEVDALVARYREIYDQDVIPNTFLFKRTWSLLRACRQRGLTLGLATTKATPIALAVLGRCRVRGLFQCIAGGDLVARPKPNPDLLQLVLSDLGADPATTVMVGDTEHDVRMGVSAGVRTVGVTWGVHEEAQLRDAGATAITRTVSELRSALLGPG